MNKVEDGRLVRPAKPRKIQGLVNVGEDKGSWCHHYAQEGMSCILWFEANHLSKIDFARDIDLTLMMTTRPFIDLENWTEPLETELAAVVFAGMREVENAKDYVEVVASVIEFMVKRWAHERHPTHAG